MSETDASADQAAGAPDLGWALGVILRRWHERVEAALGELPNSTRGFQILTVISHGEPPTQSGLAKHLNIDRTVMPYVVDSLEAAGLVERRVDPNDRRAKRIVITPHGADVLQQLESKVRQAEEEVFGDAPPAVRAAFIDQAERLAVSIQASPSSDDACSVVIDALGKSTALSH